MADDDNDDQLKWRERERVAKCSGGGKQKEKLLFKSVSQF